MEMRYPGGMKVIQYRKAKLEKFAPYLLKDGLVTKLTMYKDLECKIFADVFVFSSNIPCHVNYVHLYQQINAYKDSLFEIFNSDIM